LLDVVLDELRTLPLQPLAHFLSVRTARRAEELNPGHDRAPRATRE
jgi:hypothetical protein